MSTPEEFRAELDAVLLPPDPLVTWVSDGDRTLLFDDGSMLVMPPGRMREWGTSETK